MAHNARYPNSIHRPAEMEVNIRVDTKTPVMAPNGDSNRDNPKLASLNWKRAFMLGIAATQLPNNKLDTANKNATSSTGLMAITDLKFLNNTAQNYMFPNQLTLRQCMP